MNTIDKVAGKIKRAGLDGFLLAIIPKVYAKIKFYFLNRYLRTSVPKYGLNRHEQRTKRVIVSLTSYPPRLHALHICIKSLLWQSYKPDKVILYLGEDTTKEQLTEEIKGLVPFGLEIVFCSGNMRAHKKYLYAMQEYPNDIVITVDDDSIYDKDLILTLIKSYQRFPNAVSAVKILKMVKEDKPHAASSITLKELRRNEKLPAMRSVAIGVGGILYPPGCLPDDTFDTKMISDICSNVYDDIWLKIMEIKNDIMVVWAVSKGLRNGHATIVETQREGLFATGQGNGVFLSTKLSIVKDRLGIDLFDYCD